MRNNSLFQSNSVFIDIPTPEKILIIFNPISSVGNTRALAHRLGEFLVHHGKLVEVSESKKKMKAYMRSVNEISAYDLLVVVGGDGTIRKLLPLLSETKLPLYVVPGGNESLFAHSYGMSANTETLLKALERSQCLEQFYGVISGNGIRGAKPFFIMASMGLDSLTVKRIGKRKGPINDFTYVWSGLSSLVSLHHPTVTITVDGQVVVDCQSGYIIVANSAAYARNLQLVPAANPSINELVMGFLPGARRYHELIKIWCMLQRKPAELPLQYVSGKSLSLAIHDLSYPMQVDGDYFRNRDIEAGATLEFEVSPKPIRVLIPPQR